MVRGGRRTRRHRHRRSRFLSAPHDDPPVGQGAARLADLLSRIARQDPAALAALYRATSAKLLGVSLRILGDRSECEDVLQEVYITVWRRAGAFDATRGISPVTWLATIARNKSIDRLRGRGPFATALSEDAALGVADSAPNAEQRLQMTEHAGRLEACLDELEPPAARAIRTAFFEGVTYEALALRLEQPVGTVKSWIRRGLRRLKACLEQ